MALTIAIKSRYNSYEKKGYQAITGGGGRVPLPDEWELDGDYQVKILGRKPDMRKGETKKGYKWVLLLVWVEYTNPDGTKEQTMIRVPPSYDTLTVGTVHNVSLSMSNDNETMYASLVDLETDETPKGEAVEVVDEVL